MPLTSANLVQQIAEALGAVGDGQPVEAEDAKKIRDALPGIVADLEVRGVGTFPNLDAVPPEAFDYLVDIAASRLSSKFGLPQDEIVTLASKAQAGEQRLRQHRTLPYSGAPTRTVYF
ncbi:hypothetical protein LNAOJCKE_0950 [Methylorubrum aminovorans]|uniref:Uncharacterized protein n=1 Tax=Methylorubrum aminovorans TaxID=269069 RepID=A0ABQ4U981_9HYPH|nr:hypothetical protein [Methylorubrum aminovorans]GJE63752.1 hypothetical protein LNAOJCKE_0950 [Methylorubrum aminovorans]GMA73590.1 hypothetical protein GCM10025880_00070 [Methylorubrum aminovorans]GMA73679.1 hypothetical protein GCM10025880_00960 [Methylorubrum aminovorans]